jgi:signal transduction histidine kinase
VAKSYEHAIATGTEWEETSQLRGKDGEFRWFLIRAVPIRDENGNVTRWFGTNTDITERMKANEALKRSEKLAAAGRLAATVAHELNNPLTVAVNLVYLAQRETDAATAMQYLRDAELELQRVSRLANRTLSFFRGRSAREKVNLGDFLEQLIAVYEPSCKAKGIAVRLQVDRGLVAFAGKDELAQVITNLISNAADAIRQRGTIAVRCRAHADPATGRTMACIQVADSGHGIARKNRASLFEPFFTTKDDTGTGLGLWISKDIVEKHGGTIRVLTRTAGKYKGTIVRVCLPVEYAADPAEASVA